MRLACMAPLFLVTLRGWPHAILFLTAAGATVLLLRTPATVQGSRGNRLAIAVLLGPLAAVTLSALLRGQFDSGEFDSASRFLLAIPLLLLVRRSGADPVGPLRLVLPLALLLALGHHAVFGQPARWPADRVATAFVDPLVFGYTSLAFGLMSLVSIGPADFRGRASGWALVAWNLLGAALGLYLSILSGSRTGWAAGPVIVALWLYLYWGRGHPVRSAAAVLAACLLAGIAYGALPKVRERLDEGVTEVQNYSYSGVAPVSSIGLRLTFWRIATDLFERHPLAGVGDTSHRPPAPVTDFPYATPGAVRYAYDSAFHNQVVSNAVRWGALAVLTTLALLLAPIAACRAGLRSASPETRRIGLLAAAYFLTIAVSSVTTEVVDLKFMASFHAVMLAVLCGALLARRD